MREKMDAVRGGGAGGRATARSAQAEPLEPRRLLAGIGSGILVARGTEGADTISTRRTGTDDVIVTTNGVNQTFDMDNFTGVRLEGLGGNDRFNLIDPLTNPLVRDTTVLGGAGNDTLDYSARTGALTFRLYEEPNASIAIPYLTIDSAGGQSDKAGADVENFIGGSGEDDFFVNDSGDAGDDFDKPLLTLDGRGGDDTFLNATNLTVTMLGGAGNDFFENDESSTQSIFGQDGNDTFYLDNESTVDSISGGAGTDTLDVSTYHRGGPVDMRLFPDVENARGVGDSGTSTVIGNDLGNLITSAGDSVTIQGLGGNDTLIGSTDGDSLDGGEGNDSLVGDEGNDTLDGGPGTDTLNGGPGDDTLLNGEVTDEGGGGGTDPTSPSIEITGGVLVASGTGGSDTFSVRRTGTDNVIVTANALSREFDMDDFSGVRLEGFGGADTFNLIDALTSPVVRNTTVLGGAGSDTISYATRTAALSFSIDPTDSSMTSGAQLDVFDDVETVIGGSGGDTFNYGNGFALPEEEEDLRYDFRLDGRGGADSFISGMVSTISRDVGVTLFGGDGNDFFEQDDLGGRVFGEAGNDRILLRSFEASYEGFLDGGTGTDVIDNAGGGFDVFDLREYANIENAILSSSFGGTAYGTNGANRIDGSDADTVTILGLDGNDTLIGGSLNDSIVGGEGDDSIDAGAGTDTVDGGPGNDTVTNAEVQPAAPNIRIVSRVLTADGSWGEDEITIERTGTDDVIVRVNEVSRQFDIDDFDAVLLRGNGGFDDIRVLNPVRTSAITRRVSLQGGAGNDVLFGSEGGTESVDGGDGNDFLEVRDNFGGDTAIGGNGNDAAQVDAGDTTSGIETFT